MSDGLSSDVGLLHDHIDIQAATAGSIADAKNSSFADIKIATAAQAAPRTSLTGLPTSAAPAPAPAGN